MVLRTYREELEKPTDDGSVLVPVDGVLREVRLLVGVIACRVSEMDASAAQALIQRGMEETTRKVRKRKRNCA